MGSTWALPDHPSWQTEERYNASIATVLRHERTYRSVRIALTKLRAALNLEMSERQRMHVLARVALREAKQEHFVQALNALDEALDIALVLEEVDGQTDLLLLRASINRAILQVPDSADDLRDYLILIGMRENDTGLTPEDRAKRLDAILNLAGLEFAAGAYDSANTLLTHASKLLHDAPEGGLQPALMLWTRALLLRWSNQCDLALSHAMAAAYDYYADGAPGAASRIQAVVAEIALDLAERFRRDGNPHSCKAFLTLADPYITRALELARRAEMESSEVMATIVQLRWRRVSGHTEDRTARLRELAAVAHQHQDMALVASAYTELGRHHEALGDLVSAVGAYERVLASLRESKMTALGVWAQRALWRIYGETHAE